MSSLPKKKRIPRKLKGINPARFHNTFPRLHQIQPLIPEQDSEQPVHLSETVENRRSDALDDATSRDIVIEDIPLPHSSPQYGLTENREPAGTSVSASSAMTQADVRTISALTATPPYEHQTQTSANLVTQTSWHELSDAQWQYIHWLEENGYNFPQHDPSSNIVPPDKHMDIESLWQVALYFGGGTQCGI